MKKTVSAILVCVLLVGCIFTLASCSKSLNGKYTADLAVTEITYEFGAFGKVTKTEDPFVGDTTTVEGKYEINDEGTKITFTFNDEANTYDLSTGTEDGVDYIKIDGVKFEKVD